MKQRTYVLTEIEETPIEAGHVVITMDGVEVFRTYERDNLREIVQAAVLASKQTAMWFDKRELDGAR